MENIEIVLSIDNNYVKQCAVTIVSILKNSRTEKNINFHILSQYISEKNKKLLLKLKNIKKCNIQFYIIDENSLNNLPLNRNWISIATYYRLLITDILPPNISKVIYLDCDLICMKDIEELWNYDISEYYIGAIEDLDNIINKERLNLSDNHVYFNAGVLLLNLNKLRENSLINQSIEYYLKNKDKIVLQDQDILNGLFDGKCLNIPYYWNICTPFYHKITKHYKSLNVEERLKIYNDPGIIHFTSEMKPWIWWTKHYFKDKYWYYFSFTPFKLDYFLHLLQRFLTYFLKIETYKRGSTYNTLDLYLFNIKIISYVKYELRKSMKILGIFSYIKLRNKFSIRLYINKILVSKKTKLKNRYKTKKAE